MANIGSFKKSGQEFVGEIVTLSVQTKGVRIVPETNRTNDNAPSHRVYVGRAEIGAAWSKRSTEGSRLSLGQARRSELHRSNLRQPLRRRRRRDFHPHLVAWSEPRPPTEPPPQRPRLCSSPGIVRARDLEVRDASILTIVLSPPYSSGGGMPPWRASVRTLEMDLLSSTTAGPPCA